MAEIPVLLLRGDLLAWRSRDANGAKAALRKADLHMEYLTGRSMVVALASKKLPVETKDAISMALKAILIDSHVEMGKPEIPVSMKTANWRSLSLRNHGSSARFGLFVACCIDIVISNTGTKVIRLVFPCYHQLCKFDPTFLSTRRLNGKTMPIFKISGGWSMASLPSTMRQNAP